MANHFSTINRGRRSALQLEYLESRQLLATVSGGGEEVGSDIPFQGNVYDQILMTGSTVTVEADPGQIVRVSWIDGNGDILQGEFSGSGSLSISLDDFEPPAEAVKYNQPGVEYVSGHASFTIEGSDATTNFSLSTVGPVTSPIFDSLRVDGVIYDGVADAARLIIVSDPTQPGGSTFGGIRMANSLLTANSGIVGITAANINVQSVVIIGDFDASNTGVPTLLFGGNSQFGTIQVAGGNLAQSNEQPINDFDGNNDGIGDAYESLNFIDGTTSQGVLIEAGIFEGEFVNGGYNTETLNIIDTINIDNLNQAELDEIFLGKTFISDLMIVGDLSNQNTINAAGFRNNVIFDGVIDGDVNITNSVGGDIVFTAVAEDPDNPGANDREITADITLEGPLEGSLTFGSENGFDAVNYSGIFKAASVNGPIWVYDNFSGSFTTDLSDDNAFTPDTNEGALSDINVRGDYSGTTEGILGIGDIWIGGDLTTTAGSGKTAFFTSSGTTGDTFFANIGTLTIEGDVDQEAANDKLLHINNNGNFGDIKILGGGNFGSIDNTDFISVGDIDADGNLGSSSTGSITIFDDASDVELLGIAINSGTLGDLTITGPGIFDTDLLISGSIGGEDAVVSDISITGFQTIEQEADIDGSSVGNVSYITIDPTSNNNTFIDLDAFIDSNGAVGNVILDAGLSNSNINFNSSIDSNGGNDDVESITIIGETISFSNAGGNVIHADEIGLIEITGNTSINDDINAANFAAIIINGSVAFGDGTGIKSSSNLDSLLISGSAIFNTTSGPNILLANSGTLTFGSVDFDTNGGGTAILADDGTSSPDEIGSIVINGMVDGEAGVVDIRASAIGNITIRGPLIQGERLVTDLQILAVNNGDGSAANAETVALNGSNLSDYTIGDVKIESTNPIGVNNTFLFDGTTFIQALGSIGNISLTAGGSPAVQSGLFAGGSELNIMAGSGNAGNTDDAGVDFDGDGTIGTTPHDSSITAADENDANYSGGKVSIGNVDVIASRVSGTNLDSLLDGSNLLILSGVESPSGNTAFDGAVDAASANDPATSTQPIDSSLNGTIGDVRVSNNSQQLTPTAGTTTFTMTDATGSKVGGIFANDGFGTIQGLNQGTDLDASGDGIILGDDTVTGNIGNPADDEVIVVFV